MTSELARRPDGVWDGVVGDAVPHESAALHVTGTALYTDDLSFRFRNLLHAYPVQVPLAHARVTALRTEGIEDLLRRYPQVKAKVDSGYQGLARDFPDQVTAPPLKPKKDAPSDEVAAWEQTRKAQSSERICVEHAIAEPKQWRPLQRWIGRREYFDETVLAIAGLVSDRCAER